MIRPATHDDIPRIVAMGAQFIDGVYPAALTFNADAIATLARQLMDGGGGAFVNETSDGLVNGMIGLIVIQQPMSGEFIATELAWWIDPAARGGKAGLALLARAEAWAKAKGATRLQMIAPSDKVCRVYEKLGFQRVEVAYMRAIT